MTSPIASLSRDEKYAQLERVVHSGVLQHSPMSQKLLRFLGAKAVEDEEQEISEWTLASEVMGKSAGFDPSADTGVRTSVYRLRNKLKEYYATEGKADPIVIEIPRGRYLPAFRTRTALEDIPLIIAPEGLQVLPEVPAAPPVSPSRQQLAWNKRPVGMALCAAVLMGIGVVCGMRWGSGINDAPIPPNEIALAKFWTEFAGPERSVTIIYSNTEFLQTDNRDLFRYDLGPVDDRGAEVDPALAGRYAAVPRNYKGGLFYDDGYSGIGEVQAVFRLTRLLTGLKLDVSIKRVHLLTTDDLRDHNVVLLGSGLENKAVDELPVRRSLTLEFPATANSAWKGRIVDRRSADGQGGGVNVFMVKRDPKTHTLLSDYAIISAAHGLPAAHRILLLAGLTTSGTQAAAEFVTSPGQMSGLFTQLEGQERSAAAAPFPGFEALLEVQVVRGIDPITSRALFVRSLAKTYK